MPALCVRYFDAGSMLDLEVEYLGSRREDGRMELVRVPTWLHCRYVVVCSHAAAQSTGRMWRRMVQVWKLCL